MKTPREILLAHHRPAGPKLDAIRQSVVATSRQSAAITNPQEQPSPATATLFQTLWRELILPSRRLWSGLAAVWLVLVAINVSLHDSAPASKMTSAPVMMSAREQQRLMNELFADRSLPVEAEPPRIFVPKPHTQTFQTFAA
ncbi:MAG: hypothetical protein JF609_05285 [Verrucomicrobia bacterium]|nr:hypothetical protein [Verrucomicrobiota bacterium]